MNFQQLEYIVAIDRYRHFVIASEKCNVTQPTLSMMIQKLEDELGLKIFDRTKKPVEPTEQGIEIINRAKLILLEAERLKTYVTELKDEIKGELRLGIIPTLAPYLLPLFLKNFVQKYPDLKIFINEMKTNQIIEKIKSGEIDMGLLAMPIEQQSLVEHHLFDEEFMVYISQNDSLINKQYIIPSEIDPNQLWLLEEGHCLRNQVLNLCELRNYSSENSNLHYEAGSIETLINLVDKQQGITIIPKLASFNLNASQMTNIKEFADPKPKREIGLIVSKNFPRKKLLDKLKSEILLTLPENMQIENNKSNRISIYK